jgi:hypothetical protein
MTIAEQIASELRRITGDASRYSVQYEAEIAHMLNHEHAVIICGTQCDGAVLLELLKQLPSGAPDADVRQALEKGIQAMWPEHLRREPACGVERDPVTGRVTYWKSDS